MSIYLIKFDSGISGIIALNYLTGWFHKSPYSSSGVCTVDCRAYTSGYSVLHPTRIAEMPFAICTGFYLETCLVKQAMMSGTEQQGVIEAGFSAIRPMHYVVRVSPFLMCTARKTTTLVSGKKCSPQSWLHHAVLSAYIEWIAVFILGDWYQTAIAAKPPNCLHG